MIEEKPIVLVLDPTVLQPYDKVKEVFDVRFGKKDQNYTEDELLEIVKDITALVVTSRYVINSKIIENAPKLKIIAKCGAKPSPVSIDIEAATKRGIHVTFTPGSTTGCVAEHTIMLMLCLIKQTFFTMNKLKEGIWRGSLEKVSEISDKNIGIVGLGQIGCRVAKLLEPFGCNIYYYDPFVTNTSVNATKVNLSFLIENSDIITLHSGVTKETIHMIDEVRLQSMKQTAYLVNTSRGALIDEVALIKALKNHWIAGAALDVFEDEPPKKDNELFKMTNAIVTPHVASWTTEALNRSANDSIRYINTILNGGVPENSINASLMV